MGQLVRILNRNRVETMIVVFVIAVIVGGATGVIAPVESARATSTNPPVPLSAQANIRKKAGAEAYVPTRLVSGGHYGFRIWSFARPTNTLSIRFADLRFAPGTHPLYFSVKPFTQRLARCADGKLKEYQYDGNRVFANRSEAWRCIAGRGGAVKVTATGPHLPPPAFARIVASARRIR
jgi:hypothetical protein